MVGGVVGGVLLSFGIDAFKSVSSCLLAASTAVTWLAVSPVLARIASLSAWSFVVAAVPVRVPSC